MQSKTLRRPPRRLHWLTAALVFAFACAHDAAANEPGDSRADQGSGNDTETDNVDTSADEWRELTRAEEWAPTAYDDDPWIEERPEEIDCALQEGWQIEAGGADEPVLPG